MCLTLAINKVIFAIIKDVMKPFLKQVADHYYNLGDVQSLCFVFPNRRSMVFFRKYLAEAVAADSSALPLLAPSMLTVNDFFYKVSGLGAADKVRLLLCLYDCYKELNPKAETLDEFIFWGDVILGDFNDVDKYLVDPKQLFANVADYKALQDTFSYLTETQLAAIKAFVSHFNDGEGRLTVDLGSDNVKGRFLQIWNILYPLYKKYNETLESKGLAYEGMVYRKLAESLALKSAGDVLGDIFPDGTRFVFVGLNVLNECEKVLLRKLKDASLAEFCWDWSGAMIQDPQNRSSFFMEDNVKEFPQAAQWDKDGLKLPEFNVLSVASSVGQAKRLPDILQRFADEQYGGDRAELGAESAVVLPDENLLTSVLNSIPEDIKAINVTMGLPMSGSQIYSMMSDVAAIQLHSICRNGRWYFYHKQVWDLFAGAVFRKAVDDKTQDIISQVKKKAKYYIPQEELCGTPVLDAVFRPVVKEPSVVSSEQINVFADYLKMVVSTVAPFIADDTTLALELEYAKEYYKCVNVLQEINLEILPITFVRLLSQLLATVSVPFRGEPLKGLQIMGPLETRALDFRNLVVMSANEGVFPRRSVSSSFVPPELRRGFGLPTYEFQDAVWAYYFYRMISRAENVWLLTDTRTEGLKSGEESRYIKQLEYHFGVPLNRYVVQFDGMKTAQMSEIIKTEEDVETLKSTVLSATALQTYLACPAKFHYAVIKRLQAEEEVAESLDYGTFGTVYHDLMRSIYADESAMDEAFFFDDSKPDGGLPVKPMVYVTRDYIKGWLRREDDIRKKVKALIVGQLNLMEVSGRNLVVADVIVRYVVKTLQRDLEQMEIAGVDKFEVLGRELKVTGTFHGQRFKGYIDRLDSFVADQARVVDYKTGKVLEDDENIHDGNAEAIAEKIFSQDVADRPKIALQFYIYDMLLQSRPEVQGRQIYNCVYSTAHLFKEKPVTVPMNKVFYDAVSEKLKGLLDEMYDVSVPFRRTEDDNVCKYCDFKTICWR